MRATVEMVRIVLTTLVGSGDDTGGAVDTDGDGISDFLDNCPSIVNFDQSDSDEDGLGNACDPDDDNDGVDDESDAFPFDDSESIDTDLDGTGNNTDNDDDNDLVDDSIDNCPLVNNEDQADSDGDGIGDA